MDWERIKELRVTKKLLEGLKNLDISAIFLTPTNRRALDQKSKYLGYTDAEQMTQSETTFVLKNSKPLCKAILSTPEGMRRCKKEFMHVISQAVETGKTVCHTCHAGLTETAIPIKSGNKLAGVFRVGEFVRGDHDTATLERLKSQAKALSVDDQVIRNIKDSTAFFPGDKVAIVSNVLEMMADEIGDYVHQVDKEEGRSVSNLSTHNHDGIISADPTILNIIKQLKMVAASDSSVIIYGESGTGKELIARQIQGFSPRASKPFVTINCAALTETLLEAELFGYRKGAFTGAVSDKEGLFEAADGGTVFLDEVGEMSLGLQVKLLRLIQEGTFMRVGDTKLANVDVRIISATHQNLRSLIELGKFREDLYYRLAVVELTLPPLRERQGDVALLINFFLDYYQKKMHKDGIKLSEEVIEVLENYYWPGNIRELSNEIERIIALMSSQSLVHVKDLSKKFFYESKPEMTKELETEDEGAIKNMVDDYEKALLLRYLRKYHWNKSKVAKLCGITRQGLNKKISKYKLDRRK